MADDAAGAGAPVVRRAAPAKINLYLHVVGKRADGYHLLDSLVAFAGVGDTVEVRSAPELSLRVTGPFGARVPTGPENLVLRAARALAAASGVKTGADITLIKRLPPSSGIGGGSADAAATLHALAQLWGIGLAGGAALDLALGLGADVPVCLAGRAAHMGGIGEVLTAAPDLPETWLVMANPGVPVSTPAVFKARSGAFSSSAPLEGPIVDAAALARRLAERRNDLEEPARALVPAVAEVLSELAAQDDVLLSRMSGSGGTCYGLFADPASAGKAAARLSAGHGDWWVAVAPLFNDIEDIAE